MRTVRAAGPIALSPGENRLTQFAHYIRRGPSQALEQGVVRLDNPEVGIVGKDDVLDRIEGVPPLPLRAENLFQKSKIFDRDTKLISGSREKLHIIGGVGSTSRATQRKRPNHRTAKRGARAFFRGLLPRWIRRSD